MNIPTSIEAIAVIVILFIPGYVFLQFTKNAAAFVPQHVDARYFFAVITWGGLLHLVFFGGPSTFSTGISQTAWMFINGRWRDGASLSL